MSAAGRARLTPPPDPRLERSTPTFTRRPTMRRTKGTGSSRSREISAIDTRAIDIREILEMLPHRYPFLLEGALSVAEAAERRKPIWA